jgi:hypothetical protein
VGIRLADRFVIGVTVGVAPACQYEIDRPSAAWPGALSREKNMIARRTRTIRRLSAMLALAVSMTALSTSSGFAFSAEAQQMCTGDVFRLCSSEIPDIAKITACMRRQRASLSVACRQVMDRDDAAAAKASKVAAQ